MAAVAVDAESKSAADAADLRLSSLSTSHDVTIESWSVNCYCCVRLVITETRRLSVLTG